MKDDILNLRKMQVASFFYLLVLTLGSWAIGSWSFAWAVFVGGIISITSFYLTQKEVTGFIENLTPVADKFDEEDKKKAVKQEKIGYILKFWIRIAIIGVILLLFIKYGKINIFGLILGLSTVVFAVTFTALNAARHYFIRRR